jgi:DNA-directed RNA polymerase specialized sigma24 family protein
MTDSESFDELLQRWRDGDDSAAVEIDQQFRALLCARVSGWIGQPLRRRFDEEDIVQSTLSSFFRHARDGEYAFDDSESAWHLLLKKAYYKTKQKVEYHRAQKRDPRREVAAESADLSAEDVESLFAGESLVILKDVVEQLSDLQARILWLHLHGLNKSEIARNVGRTRFSVARYLTRATNLLRQLWDVESPVS